MPRKAALPTTPDWRTQLHAYVAAHPDRPLKLRALGRELHVPDHDYTAFRAVVRNALKEGRLVLGAGRTIRSPAQAAEVIGVFRANRRGFGFVEVPQGPAHYISPDHVHGARDGDTVAARPFRAQRGERTPKAEVLRIIERAPLRWVGILERHRGGWSIRPQGRYPLPTVTVENPDAEGSQAGDLVVVEPREETLETRTVRGWIVERLGDPSRAGPWIAGVIRRMGLRDEFSTRVEQAARRAAESLGESDVAGREDLTALTTVTIDPPDAKDFDDAISIEPLSRGHVRLGVHIADVAHFVPAGGPVDVEARARGNSVYFPGRVLPMLPQSLSNDVCSLRPGEVRLTKSVFITYDEAAQVVETRFASSVIRSAARLNYVEVSAALEGRATTIAPALLPLLRGAEELAQRIRRRRLRNGMIVLAIPEVEVRLDAQDRVVDAGPADTSFSHTIIEMFMVEANEAVSRALREAGYEHLRRIHPPPEPERAEPLAQLAPILGRRPPNVLTRETINTLLEWVRGRPEEPAVHMVLLRSLAQAAYSAADVGHFALASKDYAHFTSPIRRYPDLTVHRLVDLLLAPPGGTARGGRARAARAARGVLSDVELAQLGRHTSATERRAQQAEREAHTALLLLLMQTKLGEVLDGIITGALPLGVFVQVRPYMAEGLIHVADFGGDWRFDRESGAFMGVHSGQLIHIGQTVRVQIAAVDLLRQELSLAPIGGLGSGRREARRVTRGEGLERRKGRGRRERGRE